MSALLNSLDLASNGSHTRRSQFGYVSRLLRKSSGSCDDEFYARNLWPCRDSRCAAVLGPLDTIEDEPETASEMHAEDQRCCSVCGTFRRKVDLCIFQRCDHMAAMPWAPTQEAPLQPDSTDDEDDDETPLSKKPRTPSASASASSSSQPVMQTPQVSRKRKTFEHQASARRAVQSIPTPKRGRLVGKQAPPEVWSKKKPSSLLHTHLPKKVKLWKGARSRPKKRTQ